MLQAKRTRKKLTKLFTFSGHGLVTLGLLKVQSFWFSVIRCSGLASWLSKKIGSDKLYRYCRGLSTCLTVDTMFVVMALMILTLLKTF